MRCNSRGVRAPRSAGDLVRGSGGRRVRTHGDGQGRFVRVGAGDQPGTWGRPQAGRCVGPGRVGLRSKCGKPSRRDGADAVDAGDRGTSRNRRSLRSGEKYSRRRQGVLASYRSVLRQPSVRSGCVQRGSGCGISIPGGAAVRRDSKLCFQNSYYLHRQTVSDGRSLSTRETGENGKGSERHHPDHEYFCGRYRFGALTGPGGWPPSRWIRFEVARTLRRR
jgi:hypothetical protein